MTLVLIVLSILPKLPEELFPEWNISMIGAPQCWNAGYTGDSIIIGIIDTGADTSHPSIRGKWLEPYWYDAVNDSPYPYDDDFGKGTMQLGIILGGDGNGPFIEDIGVAPSARFVACKGFPGTYTTLLRCMDTIASWKRQGVNIRACCCGWGSPNQLDLAFWEACSVWKSLEILPIFAIGNSGPIPGTAGTPGNFPIAIGVGATNSSDDIASFSSRGPAPDTFPWNNTIYWYRPDWDLIKPDISAPGVSIRVPAPGGGYQLVNGTSFSAAHAVGAVLILCEANPNLSIREIYNLLLDYADEPPQGAPYPNNNYGWGRLNIWRALQAVLGISEQEKSVQKISHISITPNPFSLSTTIKIQEPRTKFHKRSSKRQIELKIYNVQGRLVRQWDYQTIRQSDQITWDGNDHTGNKLPAGVYFIRLETSEQPIIQKIIKVK
jgi:bacillopeptidase F